MLRHALTAFFIVALFFVAHFASANHKGVITSNQDVIASNKKTSSDDDGSKSNGTPASQSAIILQSSEPEKETQSRTERRSTDYSERTSQALHDAREEALVNFTLILAAGTIGLMVFTGGLWWETRRLARLAKEQATDTREALAISARAADAAVVTASSTRAWLTFDRVEGAPVNGMNLEGVHFERGVMANVHMTNTGRSPAIRVRTASQFRFLPIADPLPHFPLPGLEEQDQLMTIGPGGSFIPIRLGIPDEHWAEVIRNTHRIIFWAKIVYEDVFHSGFDRISEMTFQVHVNGVFRKDDGAEFPVLDFRAIGIQNSCS